VEALMLKSRAYRIGQQEREEDVVIDTIIHLAPEDYRTHLHRGRRLQGVGKFKDAEYEFLRSIELNPRQGVAYHGIVTGRKITPQDAGLLETMEVLARDEDLSEDDRAHLEYGLGKAYDNLNEFGQAMAHFDVGNRLMGQMRPWTRRFEQKVMQRKFERLMQIFNYDEMRLPVNTPEWPVEPLIVSGIMRSGTTLMEQILSKHPEIGAAGEQQLWQESDHECIDYEGGTYNMKRLMAAANQYCDLLTGIAPGRRMITEKNPANRTAYGLIHRAFPKTRILHMQRNPVDVAISIYTTMMRTGAPFMGDKDAIVFALKMHKRLTEHWLEVLPEDNFRIVSYEKLTAEPEPVTRETIAFLGLPWVDECLSPQSNERTVATPSLWQVRQPVYTSSVERWRRYEPWLGPFAELIE
jgi:tetratricopeptide (TPR) repeat protein